MGVDYPEVALHRHFSLLANSPSYTREPLFGKPSLLSTQLET